MTLNFFDLYELKNIDPRDFLYDMQKMGYIKSGNISGDYSRDVSQLCQDASLWLANKLDDPENTKIITGTFMWEGWICLHHVWLEYREFYIDMTLSQFLTGVPKIAVSEKKFGPYFSIHSCSIFRYLRCNFYYMIRKDCDLYRTKLYNLMPKFNEINSNRALTSGR